jgi:magnesium transporter
MFASFNLIFLGLTVRTFAHPTEFIPYPYLSPLPIFAVPVRPDISLYKLTPYYILNRISLIIFPQDNRRGPSMQELEILDVRNLITQRSWTAVRQAISEWPAAEIADLLLHLDPDNRVMFFRVLPRRISGDVFSLLESEQQNELLDDLTRDETRQLLASLSPDDRTQLFEELPGQVTQRLLNLLSPEDLAETRQLLGYPEESVGRLMTPDYVAVRPEWTIQRALEHVRKKGKDSETVNVLYVTDTSWKLIDALDLRRFILADPNSTVADIMDTSFIALSAFDDREMAVHTMQRYDLPALPVVDSSGVLLGIVTFDDVMDVAEVEVTEDFHKTAAVAPIRGSYRNAPFGAIYRKRVGWLIVLVFTNIFSGAAIASFEDTIAAVVALVFFLPLLIDSSGNAGSQAATLMVRALAMGEVKLGDWASMLGKELLVAGALGLTMGFAVVWLGIWRGGTEVGVIVALTMIIVVIVGSVIGTILPFILSKFRFDPATASAPLITSLADISGVLIYFSLATWLLRING